MGRQRQALAIIDFLLDDSPRPNPGRIVFCDNVAAGFQPVRAVTGDNMRVISILLVLSLSVLAQEEDARAPRKYSFSVSASQTWTDTGVDLAPGDLLTLTTETKADSPSSCTPAGDTNISAQNLPLSAAAPGA